MNDMVEATSPCGEETKGDGNAGDCMVVAGSDPAWDAAVLEVSDNGPGCL